MQISGKTALVTGAARGIGQAIAIELAEAGADIIGVDLTVAEQNDTATKVRTTGRAFAAYACDLSDLELARQTVATIIDGHGCFDVLVNNAGVMASGAFADGSFSIWQRTIEINLTATMNLTHAVLPAFLQRGGGHIVNIASIAGKFGTEGLVAYAASKHGIVGFSSALRAELADKNIGVSWICPSPARTRMAEDVKHTFLTPLIEPIDVARAVRRAIEKNAVEIFVPAPLRFTTTILPGVAPRFARWLSRISRASQGWLIANKEIQVPARQP